MKVSFEGMGEMVATFYSEGAVSGECVKLNGNATVTPCAEGDRFFGVAIGVSEQHASVILAGAVTLPYSGTAPVAGFQKLVANGNGGVKLDAGGREHSVISAYGGNVTIIL